MNNAWQQLSITVNAEGVDFVSDTLMELGAVAVTFHETDGEEILEPLPGTEPLWKRTRVTGLFTQDFDLTRVLIHLTHILPSEWNIEQKIELLGEQDWVRQTQQQTEPQQFGKRLWIYPSWIQPSENSENINLILDPGVAFGTGTHPTTRLCLEWLDQHGANYPVVIDYGCGSGILALAAIKLGAQMLWAIDHDPQALWSTQENAKNNNINLLQLKTALPDEIPDLKVDLILANILANPLIELKPRFKQLLKPNGILVMTGILQSQLKEIETCYQNDFIQRDCKIHGDWVLVEYQHCF